MAFPSGLSAGMLYNYATATGGVSTTEVRRAGHLSRRVASSHRCGIRVADRGRAAEGFLDYAGFRNENGYGDSSRGYLLGGDPSGADQVRCLSYSEDSAPVIKDMLTGYYFPLRCVKD